MSSSRSGSRHSGRHSGRESSRRSRSRSAPSRSPSGGSRISSRDQSISIQPFCRDRRCCELSLVQTCCVKCSRIENFLTGCIYACQQSNRSTALRFTLTQCDQIWLNFATLAKFQKPLANFRQFISYLAKYLAYFGEFVTLLD